MGAARGWCWRGAGRSKISCLEPAAKGPPRERTLRWRSVSGQFLGEGSWGRLLWEKGAGGQRACSHSQQAVGSSGAGQPF